MNTQHTKRSFHDTSNTTTQANTRDADRRTRRVRLLQIIDHRETQSQRQIGERRIPSRQRPEQRSTGLVDDSSLGQ